VFVVLKAISQWPGYDPRSFDDPMRSRIDVRPGGRDITRQNLAREVCGLLFNFHKVISVSISSHPSLFIPTRIFCNRNTPLPSIGKDGR